MQKSLDEARVDVQQMKAERDLFAENMKKAFMRGVCALNLEAMTMFRGGSGSNEGGGSTTREAEGHSSDSNSTDCDPRTGNPPYQVHVVEQDMSFTCRGTSCIVKPWSVNINVFLMYSSMSLAWLALFHWLSTICIAGPM